MLNQLLSLLKDRPLALSFPKGICVLPAPPRVRPYHLNALTFACVITLLLLLTAFPLHAQGCAQCLDSTRATPPAVQAAYRHAILLLGGTAITLFLAGALLLRQKR